MLALVGLLGGSSAISSSLTWSSIRAGILDVRLLRTLSAIAEVCSADDRFPPMPVATKLNSERKRRSVDAMDKNL